MVLLGWARKKVLLDPLEDRIEERRYNRPYQRPTIRDQFGRDIPPEATS